MIDTVYSTSLKVLYFCLELTVCQFVRVTGPAEMTVEFRGHSCAQEKVLLSLSITFVVTSDYVVN